jgi:hypothetical protein
MHQAKFRTLALFQKQNLISIQRRHVPKVAGDISHMASARYRADPHKQQQ